ncbi:hypothetical protein [Microbacterium enclense]|uniref:hypothetical protein n=1 Tax=Microbacterium enclense TaxID=993073 RepID=UPI003F8125AA
MSDWSRPAEVTDVDIAFPARGPELTPAYETVSEEFKSQRNVWVRVAERWFFHGDPFDRFDIYGPVEGVDGDLAVRHLQVVLGTYGTKHQHKIAGAAFLLSLWFERAEERAG